MATGKKWEQGSMQCKRPMIKKQSKIQAPNPWKVTLTILLPFSFSFSFSFFPFFLFSSFPLFLFFLFFCLSKRQFFFFFFESWRVDWLDGDSFHRSCWWIARCNDDENLAKFSKGNYDLPDRVNPWVPRGSQTRFQRGSNTTWRSENLLIDWLIDWPRSKWKM